MLSKHLLVPTVLGLSALLSAGASTPALAHGGGHGGGGHGGGHMGGGHYGGGHMGGGHYGGGHYGGGHHGGYYGGGFYGGGLYGGLYGGGIYGSAIYGGSRGLLGGGYYGSGYYPYGYGYGSGFGYGSGYGYGYASPSYSYYSAPATTYIQQPAVVDNNAYVRVLVPDASAKVYFDGKLTSQTGTDRLFHSPALEAGNYSYVIHATWMQNGKEMSRDMSVNVAPGQTSLVDFTRAPSETLKAPTTGK